MKNHDTICYVVSSGSLNSFICVEILSTQSNYSCRICKQIDTRSGATSFILKSNHEELCDNIS